MKDQSDQDQLLIIESDPKEKVDAIDNGTVVRAWPAELVGYDTMTATRATYSTRQRKKKKSQHQRQ